MGKILEFKTAETTACVVKPGDPWPQWIPDYRGDFERPHCVLVGWVLSYMKEPGGLFESWKVFWFAKREKRQFYSRWTGFRPKRIDNEVAARLPPDYEPGDKIAQNKVTEQLNDPENALSVIIRPDLLSDKPPPANIRLSGKLNEKCKAAHKDEYRAFSFNEFLSLLVDWGLEEVELRREVKESWRNAML